MAVITIAREAGSGGGTIAQLLAKSLGYHLVDDAVLRSMLVQYGVVDFDEVYNAAPGITARFVGHRSETTDLLNRMLAAVASHGDVVIVGRGGYAALRERADVLNVRVQAPLPIRARRLVDRGEAKDLDAARVLATDSDKRRASFVKLSYGLVWDSTHDYDLVIDTAKLSPESACSLVARAALALDGAEAGFAPVAAADVDPVLAGTVSEVLGCRSPHSRTVETTSPAPA